MLESSPPTLGQLRRWLTVGSLVLCGLLLLPRPAQAGSLTAAAQPAAQAKQQQRSGGRRPPGSGGARDKSNQTESKSKPAKRPQKSRPAPAGGARGQSGQKTPAKRAPQGGKRQPASGRGKSARGGRRQAPAGPRIKSGNIWRPRASNPQLASLIDSIYEGDLDPKTRVGTGSLADAIRLERVKRSGSKQAQRGRTMARSLQSWIQRNPLAEASDIRAASMIQRDLQAALGGK